MSDENDIVQELRSFGRRRGRKLSARQSVLMSDALARVRVDLAKPIEDAGGARALFPIDVREIWLEIGFGGGEHLVWQAEHNRGVGLIGCEPFQEGVVKVLAAIDAAKLTNLRLYPDDARGVLRWLPEASIDRAFVLFPDPWPKKKHRKRRLVSAATLALLARVMRPGAELRIATDIGDYARTMLIAIQATPRFRWTATCAANWRQRPDDWPPTRYERKAEREGRRSCYFRFVRV